MSNESYAQRLRINEPEVRTRRAFFELEDADLDRLGRHRHLADEHDEAIVEDFYELLLAHAESRRHFQKPGVLRRVKGLQSNYFRRLFGGVLDRAYVEDRLRVGVVHERIGLDPKWYLGAYRRFLEATRRTIMPAIADADERERVFRSLIRIVFFDMSLALDAYIAESAEAIRRHQAAIRELSTPVITVSDDVLLLPIVGTVDSYRAQQVMETVLHRVSDEKARVLILDIAGVAIVDTEVADHLLKTTASVGLLGAEVILTGISPEVARTVVQLGVDISSMHTRARLAEGIELALSLVGKRIVSSAEGRA